MLAAKYHCHVSTIRRFLALAKAQGICHGNLKVSVAYKKKGSVGKKVAYTAEQIEPKLLQLSDMLASVHLDEKWFYLTKTTRKYYLVPGEQEPQRKCKSKRYNDETSTWWGGEIGTWPFVESVPPQRASVNRPAGTYETKLLTVTKDVDNKTVMLQHDNARAHVTPMDPQLKAAFDEYGKDGWSFSLAPQPPNSPDTNILDIGFFAAVQSLQQKKSAKTIDDLVANVGQAFDEYPMESLGRTFLSLQACLVEAMSLFGDNAYKLPHK
ncbi:hypothetical protein H310_13565 [Aphanomyces invadans]|uniref:Uncharacterized protein n=1 Tax=Aphanomyces invadans TaxID=157072 RepID=A0A024TD00_9STRA|nr:hypothetical protein H310_13565 [Aphanomyces invadans]ETV92040.1 hypothetical protein H310_13565 [Aphanomyces invadans]|eukprot:XP_008879337.1 hypothetical protein H310_13565 [Aphanomyces invadans]